MITKKEWKENGRAYYWNNYRDDIRCNSDVTLRSSKREINDDKGITKY